VREYLEGFGKSVTPALEQGKVVGDLAKNINMMNFVATWPTVRKNVDELHSKIKSAQEDYDKLAVPPAASALNQLVHDDMAVLLEMSEKSLALGDKAAGVPKGMAGLKELGSLRPQVEELQALRARQIEVASKLEIELTNLRKKEHL
jgi:hypothetical protein